MYIYNIILIIYGIPCNNLNNSNNKYNSTVSRMFLNGH